MAAKTARFVVLSGFAASCLLHGPGFAEPGLSAVFDFTQRLESEREEVGPARRDTILGVTQLRFGLTSVTRTQELGLSLGSSLNADPNTPDDLDVDAANSRLNYVLLGPRSRLRFRLDYNEADIEDSSLEALLRDQPDVLDSDPDILDEEEIFDDEILDEDEIVDIETGRGRRTAFEVRTDLSLGIGGPLTLDLRHSYRELDYSDVTDPNLTDRTRQLVSATIGMEITPTFSLDTVLSWNEQLFDSPTTADQTTTRVALNAIYDVRPGTTLTGSINQTDIDTTSDSANTGGLGYALGFREARPNGGISANFFSTETVNGLRRQVQAGRFFDFRRTSLDISAGAAKTGSFDIEPLVNLRLRHQVNPTAALSVQLSQRLVINAADEETLLTRLGVNYSQQINSRSSFDGSLQFAQQDVLAVNGNDQDTLRGSLTYRYDIGNEWDFITGYEAYRSNRSTTNDTQRDTLFFGISKSISFRP